MLRSDSCGKLGDVSPGKRADVTEAAAVSEPERFQRLAVAVQALVAARTRDEVIEVVRRSARALSGAMGVAIVLRSGDFCHYLVEDSRVPLWSGQRFPMSACISGWAMTHGQQVVIPDIYQDARIPHDAYRPTGVHSLVMTPVGEPEAVGALGAYWLEVRDPRPDEVAALAALANCMATALRNIELVESLRDETRHQQVLINELNHRVKNTLAIIQSLARQSLRGDRALPEAAADFEARLMALSSAHNLVTDTRWRAVETRDLIEGALRPFGLERFAIDGPEMRLEPRAAVAFALALHELGTNAAKYGALSTAEGRVAIRWRIHADEASSRLHFLWRESGGPPVVPPARSGVGMRLIERGLAVELAGKVALRFEPGGVECEIDAPIPDAARIELGGPAPPETLLKFAG
jgi:two-component sensor histidine kinase